MIKSVFIIFVDYIFLRQINFYLWLFCIILCRFFQLRDEYYAALAKEEADQKEQERLEREKLEKEEKKQREKEEREEVERLEKESVEQAKRLV